TATITPASAIFEPRTYEYGVGGTGFRSVATPAGACVVTVTSVATKRANRGGKNRSRTLWRRRSGSISGRAALPCSGDVAGRLPLMPFGVRRRRRGNSARSGRFVRDSMLGGGGPPVHLMWSSMFNRDRPTVTKRVDLRRIGAFFKPYWLQQSVVLVCILAGALLGLLPPLFTKWLIDRAIPAHDMHAVWLIVGGMVVSALLAGVIGVYQGYLNSLVGEGIMRDIRTSLVSHLHRMPLSFFTGTKTGEIMNRVSNDVDNIDNVVTGTLVAIVTNVFTMVTTVVTIFVLDWRLALVALAVIPLMILPLSPVGRRMFDVRKLTRRKRDEIEAITQ